MREKAAQATAMVRISIREWKTRKWVALRRKSNPRKQAASAERAQGDCPHLRQVDAPWGLAAWLSPGPGRWVDILMASQINKN
jgi:hypothetical protein